MEELRKQALKIETRYAFVQTLYWAAACTLEGFTAVFLSHRGMSDSQVGMTVSAISVAAILFQLIISNFSDHHPDIHLKRIIAVLFLFSYAAVLLLNFSRLPVLFTGLLFILCDTPQRASSGLLNAMLIRYCNAGIPARYGWPRGVGSIGWAACAYLFGILMERKDPDILPELFLIIEVAAIASLLFMPEMPGYTPGRRSTKAKDTGSDNGSIGKTGVGRAGAENISTDRTGTEKPGADRAGAENISTDRTGAEKTGADKTAAKGQAAPQSTSTYGQMLRENKALCLFLLSVIFTAVGQAAIGTFLNRVVESLGGGTKELGIAIFIQSGMELPALFCSVFLLKKYRAGSLVIFSFASYTMRSVALALCPSLTVLYIIMFSGFICYGMYCFSGVIYVNEIVRDDQKVRGQSLVSLCFTSGIGGVIGNTMGGVIMDHFGLNMIYLFSTILSIVGIAFMIASLRCRGKMPR